MTHHRARELRRFSTETERRLWSALRSRRLGGFRFRRQHQLGPYDADFVCCSLKLVIEADGTHHIDDEQRWYDQRRSAQLEKSSYRILRVSNAAILHTTAGVLAVIAEALRDLQKPTPERHLLIRHAGLQSAAPPSPLTWRRAKNG